MTNALAYFGARGQAKAESRSSLESSSGLLLSGGLALLCGAIMLTSSAHAQEVDATKEDASSQETKKIEAVAAPMTADGPVEKKKPKKEAKQILLVLIPTGDDVPENGRRTVASLVSVECQSLGYEVITADDVKKVIELEADKQAAGCVDESCIAELAGALGAELVVFGDVGKLGSVMIFTFNFYNSDEARSTGRVSMKVHSLEEVPDVLPAAMAKLVNKKQVTNSAMLEGSELKKAPSSTTTATKVRPEKEGSSLGWVWWSVAGVGVATALGGLAADQLLPTSSNDEFDAVDVSVAVAMGVGVLVAGTGLTLALLDVGGE
ncbi:MAG: hypothetical protein GY822_14005 [Deltaproteobacteria bacterium]|nr:hypothetical protein [Deltaproteobacteria bacterium]